MRRTFSRVQQTQPAERSANGESTMPTDQIGSGLETISSSGSDTVSLDNDFEEAIDLNESGDDNPEDPPDNSM